MRIAARFAGAVIGIYSPVGLMIALGIGLGWSRGMISIAVFWMIVIVTALVGYLLDRPPPGVGGVVGVGLLMFLTFPVYLAWTWASERARLSWRFKRS